MIRRALSSIPARPAVIAAPLLAAAVLAAYYHSVYRDCAGTAELRQRLYASVGATQDRGEPFVLAEFTRFPWQYVRLFEAFSPRHDKRNCPLGWDWSNQRRNHIAREGRLSVMLFFYDDALVKIMEFDNDRVSVAGVDEKLSPGDARFKVLLDPGAGYRLTPAGD